ncbi:MAG: gliding motility-associated C-terminal domain-containing protein [Candidatus Electryonea clarkiae]|nr:gliding motility-associated C-terminal domain-containing protein [Candidatus Electryonea clarkiae]MDP8286053.1 gliding motility-associated C-terminal domain-containing protein [Candidatus Electryonea clarkiae]
MRRFLPICNILLSNLLLCNIVFAQGEIDLAPWHGNISWWGSQTDRLGMAVTTGDFDGDGTWDLAVSAPGARNNSGDVYLFFGEFDPVDSVRYNDLSIEADLIIRGSDNIQLGIRLVMGDINGDSREDLIIGAPRAGDGRGEVWVIFGTSTPPGQMNAPDVRIIGADDGDGCGEAIGTTILSGENQIQDIVVGSPGADPYGRDSAGRVDVIRGRAANWFDTIELADIPSEVTVFGGEQGERLGTAVSVAISFGGELLGNNLNSDNMGDLIMSSPGRTYSGRSGAGAVHVFINNESLTDTIDLDPNTVHLLQGYRQIGGASPLDKIGRSLCSFHEAGSRSLLIGAPSALVSDARRGAVYQVTWSEMNPGSPWVGLNQSNNYRLKLVGNESGDSLGVSVMGISGLMLIGANGKQFMSRDNAGAIYAITGNPNLTGIIDLDTLRSDVRVMFGAGAGDELGFSIALADLDMDDIFDIMGCAPVESDYQGAAYAMRGGLPYAYGFHPFPGQRGVSSQDTIRFYAKDDEEGIDIESIRMQINNIDYDFDHIGLSYESDNGLYRLSVVPEDTFEIDVPINIRLHIADDAGNHSPFYSFQFVTGRDDRAPNPTGFSPSPFAVDVPVNSHVSFSLIDVGSGVDQDSIRVTIESETYTADDPELILTGTIHNLRVIVDPQGDFPSEESITVIIEAADRTEPSPNIMPSFEYFFITARDTTPPQINFIYPEPGSTIDIGTQILFRLLDTGTGIDTSNTFLYRRQADQTLPADLEFLPTSSGAVVTHTPGDNFYLPEELNLIAISRDRNNPPNIMSDTTWTYDVVEDEAPPQLISAVPAPDSIGAARNTSIIIDILDNAAGIDSTTLVLEINGNYIYHREMEWLSTSHLHKQITYSIQQTIYDEVVEVHLNVRDKTVARHELDTTYTFETLRDEDDPLFLLIDPPQGAEGVPISDSLIWEVVDDFTGVNPTSAFLVINGVNQTDRIEARTDPVSPGAGYRFIYVPLTYFEYEDTLIVRFGVSDREQPPNEAVLVYNLITQPDEDPPYLANLSPYPDQSRVSRGADITLQVLDNGVGVELDSIFLFIRDEFIPKTSIFSEEVDRGYAIRYNPPGLFSHSDTVNVTVWAHDEAVVPNIMQEEYSFITLSDDREPPFLANITPGDSTTGWPVNAGFSFDLLDDGAGVDPGYTRIEFIDEPLWTAVVKDSAIDLGYHYDVTPVMPFFYSDTVTIAVIASDIADPPNGRAEPQTFTFFVQRDDVAPVITNLDPTPDSSITSNRFIEFYALDQMAGIDTASILFIVDGIDRSEEVIKKAAPEGWRVWYRPPEEGWTIWDTLDISIHIEDLSAGRNFADKNYTVNIIPDRQPPYINLFRIGNDSIEVRGASSAKDSLLLEDISPETDSLHIDLIDNGVGVRMSSLFLKIMSRNYDNFVIADSIRLGYRLNLPLADVGLFPGQLVEIKIAASDSAGPPNVMRVQRLYFRIEAPENDLEAVPTTITPNGDGVWDVTMIWHPGGASTEVSIFDMRGRKVDTIRGKPAEWDGLDQNGEPVPGGLYIFQLEAEGKIRQGTIAVAR